MKGKVVPTTKKHNKSLRLVLFFPFRCCFAGSLPFSLSTVKQTKLFHSFSEMFFTFLATKTLWVKVFSLNVCEAALQAAIKGGNFGAKLTHFCGFWLDVSFFQTREKTSFAICLVPTRLSLKRARKGRREEDNGRDGVSPAVCTLPMVPCGSSPVACEKQSAWRGGCACYLPRVTRILQLNQKQAFLSAML